MNIIDAACRRAIPELLGGDLHGFRLREARLLEQNAGPACQYLLLGSIATEKYTEPLLNVFGDRLLFPVEFVGRGDMSRGGLMLRRASSGEQLSYVSLR